MKILSGLIALLTLSVTAAAETRNGIIYNSNERDIPRLSTDNFQNSPAAQSGGAAARTEPAKDLLRGHGDPRDAADKSADKDGNDDHDHDGNYDRDSKRGRHHYARRAPTYVFVNPGPQILVTPSPVTRVAGIAMIDRAQPFVETTCEAGFSISDMAYTQVAGLVPMQFTFRDNDPVGVAGGVQGGAQGSSKGGSLIGILTGDQIGGQNEQCAAEALEYAASGTQIIWRDASSDDAFMVQPVRTFKRYDYTCREFITRIEIDGAGRQAYGTACRDKSGGWALQN